MNLSNDKRPDVKKFINYRKLIIPLSITYIVVVGIGVWCGGKEIAKWEDKEIMAILIAVLSLIIPLVISTATHLDNWIRPKIYFRQKVLIRLVDESDLTRVLDTMYKDPEIEVIDLNSVSLKKVAVKYYHYKDK